MRFRPAAPDSPPSKRPRSPRPRWMVAAGASAAVLLVGSLVVAFAGLTGGAPPSDRYEQLSKLQSDLAAGHIVSAEINDGTQVVTAELADGSTYEVAYPLEYGSTLTENLLAGGAEVKVEPISRPSAMVGYLFGLVPVIIIIGFLLFFLRGKAGLGVGNFGKGKGAPVAAPGMGFAQIAGCDEVVDELTEVVEYLTHPERFCTTGARLPRGFLLVGPPGTGKTLIARAVAGEAGVPFFSLSGSDFVETFVGVGASRVRQVFRNARKSGKAIIFIDELDAIGRARVSGPSNGSTEEREATLNQLLVEMDGFAQDEGIFVLAATNRQDVLDAALLRPGRFDRHISVPAPDWTGRQRILELYARDLPFAPEIDFARLARRTAGFTGADLSNLANQAALGAARDGSEQIREPHLDAALATVVLGPERRSVKVLEQDRQITAWHEAGHTVAAFVQVDAQDPVQVSIVPRGGAGGVTWMAGHDRQFLSRRQALAQLVVAMAGRAAEELLLDDDFTQGAASDFRAASDLAHKMVTEYGMSALGVGYLDHGGAGGPVTDDVRAERQRLLDEALETARALLRTNQDLLAAVAERLLAEESMELAEIQELADQAASAA